MNNQYQYQYQLNNQSVSLSVNQSTNHFFAQIDFNQIQTSVQSLRTLINVAIERLYNINKQRKKETNKQKTANNSNQS